MQDLRQQKIEIDKEAQRKKDEADRIATEERQYAADEESKKVEEQAQYDIAQIQKNAQT